MTKRNYIPYARRARLEAQLAAAQPTRPSTVASGNLAPSASHEVQRVQDKQNFLSRWRAQAPAPTPAG